MKTTTKMNTTKLLPLTKLIAVATAAAALAAPAFADTLTWGGAEGVSWSTDGAWTDSNGGETNWNDGSDVVFGSDGSKTVTVDDSVTAGTVTITDAYTFDIDEEATLTTSTLTINDGSLTLAGDGTVNFSSAVHVGDTDGCEGSIEICVGQTTFSSSYLYIGGAGTGSMTISGGENSFHTTVYIGYESGASGSMTIEDGTNTFTGSLNIGFYDTTSEGILKINGGNNLFSTGLAYVGWQGHGTIEITGGETSFEGTELYLGCATDAVGEMKISGGKTTFGTYTTIGNNGTGKVTISGDATVVKIGVLYLGRGKGSYGTIEITGGTTTFVDTYSQWIGYNGTGKVTISGDATVVDFGYLYVGYGSSSSNTASGELTISGGTVTIAGPTYVGYRYGATGIVTITGGDVMFSGNVTIGGAAGKNYGATGEMTISGGKTTFSGSSLYIGYGNSSSSGTLTISGGETTCASTLYINYRDGSSGTMTISGGTNNTFLGTVYVGYDGTGKLDISGGTNNTFSGIINIGYSNSSVSGTGTMTISGGTTTIKGATTINDGSSLTIGDNEATEGKATVKLETQIGTTTTGAVTISGNANIVLSGALLEEIAEQATSGSTEGVAVICANTITFGDTKLSDSFSGDEAYNALINQYVSAGNYVLSWVYDGNGTLYVIATTPEPSMFGLFFGLGAIGLVATRRRRRVA